ncbi:hypothetical protein [Campylobacter showae]|uniref:Metallo-beta-lactamase family protein n=1 Tax=Campylobacter showae CC57C TaxID=1073353 RepID=M3IJ68_9BACT|nr:hypothetical protein [Campylobacter showae]EMG30076.1 metallo-beta-lactamase family protein [Campylobacter showae CC57C]
MQTLTIRTDNADFIEKAREILITLAKFDGVKLSLSDDYTKELNARADEALQGKGLIDEAQARKKLEAIKTEILSDIEAIRRGEFETISHDELKARVMQW